ncbi:hypothetical protein CCACVL1_07237, partial [Corchorus capsularis]
MEIMSSRSCCENIKRAWRRRKYKRLHGAKRKLKIVRLGNKETRRPDCESKRKLSLKMATPTKIFRKVHEAYVEMTTRLVNNMGKANEGGLLFRGKKVAKDRHVSAVSGGDEIDTRLLLQIYK